MAGLDLGAHLLDELVVDAIVAERTAQGAAGCADGQAQPGREEQQADQHTPEGAAQGAGPYQADRLLDLDLAVLPAHDDGGVGKADELQLLQPGQFVAHLLRAGLILECEYYQCCHFTLL